MKFKYFTLQKMTYFGNLNLASYTITPAQSPNDKLFMFFESIPQELVFYGPAPIGQDSSGSSN
jgi:hypothetical protein